MLSTSVILFDLNYWPRQRLLNYGFFLYSIAPINFYFQISPSVRSHEMSSLFFFNIKVNPIIKQKGESCGHIQNLSSIPSHRRRLPMCCTYMLIYRASLRLDHLPCLNFSFSNFFIFSKLFDPILTWNSQFVTSGKVGNLEVEFGFHPENAEGLMEFLYFMCDKSPYIAHMFTLILCYYISEGGPELKRLLHLPNSMSQKNIIKIKIKMHLKILSSTILYFLFLPIK